MPNLKDIRRRIKSVKNTQKITQAMRMVAAAKVKRSEAKVKAARPYGEALREIFVDVYRRIRSASEYQGSDYLKLLQQREIKNVGIVVISSDRGLCGSFNATVIRQAFQLESELKEKGLTPKFYFVGNKVNNSFRRYSKSDRLGSLTGMTAAPTIQDSNVVAETLVKAFIEDEIDCIEVLSTHFKSMLSYKVELTNIIPVSFEEDADALEAHEAWTPEIESIMEFEPDPVQALEKLVPMYLSNSLYLLLLESAASELAARMTAMANATTNAAEMINKLTLDYNKARQASITQELLEVVGGAEALK